ncbi:hypothetical protein GCM10029992_22020 [Glycomyces albus]
MAGEEAAPPTSDLSWLLDGLIEKVPGARSALLLSADGIKKAFSGLEADQADQLSAIASGMFSLARTAGANLGAKPGVDRSSPSSTTRSCSSPPPARARSWPW